MEAKMQTATFSELRNHAKKYFDAVERGETVEIYRHGKPVARISPVRPKALQRWRQAHPLDLGVSASRMIIEERRKGR
jgi:prevent-host-death family protein